MNNLPNIADHAEVLRDELGRVSRLAQEAIKAGQEPDLNHALKRIREVSKEAERRRKEEKAPYLAAAREVDERWKPVVSALDDLARQVRAALTEIRRRIAEERAKEAERLRQEAELRRAMAEVTDDPLSRAMEAEQAKAAERAAKAAKRAPKGLRRQLRLEVEDLATAVAHYLKDPTVAEELRAVVAKAARRDIMAGKKVPGVRSWHEEVAI